MTLRFRSFFLDDHMPLLYSIGLSSFAVGSVSPVFSIGYLVNPDLFCGGVVMRNLQQVGLALVLLIVLPAGFQTSVAQEVTAAVVGTVVDPSGAPVKGAAVVARIRSTAPSIPHRQMTTVLLT